ncbi:MAG: outer membrane lipid asymmetry maintenance protein MlaD [Burkholderiaceae bacterium]|jgi:phospholipid/cholesterol/gamma-HCH transport system substrate-binding protein|nr:outer membrane lipid asymmetry maintenance protein MlaD [Burkholderiaceae bacterium]
MGRSKNDVWVGLFVLAGLAALVFLALQSANLASLSLRSTYRVTARFENIGGLKPKAAVRSAGVVVGRVAEIQFDNTHFQANVVMEMDARHKFPKDSSMQILTSGLLGEQYVGISPGYEEESLAAGGIVTHTQSAVVLESLIGQFLYNQAASGGGPGAAAVKP